MTAPPYKMLKLLEFQNDGLDWYFQLKSSSFVTHNMRSIGKWIQRICSTVSYCLLWLVLVRIVSLQRALIGASIFYFPLCFYDCILILFFLWEKYNFLYCFLPLRTMLHWLKALGRRVVPIMEYAFSESEKLWGIHSKTRSLKSPL